MHETFFFWSAITKVPGEEMDYRKQQVILRFEHARDLPLLEAIEHARQLSIGRRDAGAHILIPFDDAELDTHLEYIRPYFY